MKKQSNKLVISRKPCEYLIEKGGMDGNGSEPSGGGWEKTGEHESVGKWDMAG